MVVTNALFLLQMANVLLQIRDKVSTIDVIVHTLFRITMFFKI